MYNGEEKTILLTINSSTPQEVNITLSSATDEKGISTKLEPKSIKLRPGEPSFSDLTIKADAESKLYPITIRSYVSCPRVDWLGIGRYISTKLQSDINNIDELSIDSQFPPEKIKSSYVKVNINPFSFPDW